MKLNMQFPITCKDTGEVVFNYDDYLRTEHWKALKQRYYQSRLTKVCACGASSGLQLHHKTYKRLGREYLGDLRPVCGRCHRFIHNALRSSSGSRDNLWSMTSRVIKRTKKGSMKSKYCALGQK